MTTTTVDGAKVEDETLVTFSPPRHSPFSDETTHFGKDQ